MDERFQQQIADLSSRYDHVIIDSPPVLAVTDPALISRIAGVVLLVAKAGVHPMREIEQSVKKLQRVGANLRGIVFNSMPVSAGTAYGYGSHTNYSAKDAKV
jgi:tyrosine-protein kinase Etk/Wzc